VLPHKDLRDISCTSPAIAHFVPHFFAIATGIIKE